jgi:hypothetical protein
MSVQENGKEVSVTTENSGQNFTRFFRRRQSKERSQEVFACAL